MNDDLFTVSWLLVSFIIISVIVASMEVYSISLLNWPPCHPSLVGIGRWCSVPGAEARRELCSAPYVSMFYIYPSACPTLAPYPPFPAVSDSASYATPPPLKSCPDDPPPVNPPCTISSVKLPSGSAIPLRLLATICGHHQQIITC